jgi:hypothetical protein
MNIQFLGESIINMYTKLISKWVPQHHEFAGNNGQQSWIAVQLQQCTEITEADKCGTVLSWLPSLRLRCSGTTRIERGNTGFSCWDAGLYCAEWVARQSNKFSGRCSNT